jgi:hypothetical protein
VEQQLEQVDGAGRMLEEVGEECQRRKMEEMYVRERRRNRRMK